MASLLDLLSQTWPARMGQAAWQAVKAPGDAYAGRLDPLSDEGIGRATDLAGMVMGGTAFNAPRGALGAGPGIRAYHGSPHDFERFDLGKIGTGEGAQAYGHGLYFAENPAVAREYRTNLASQTLTPKAQEAYGPRIAQANAELERAYTDFHNGLAANKPANEMKALQEKATSAQYKVDQLHVDAAHEFPNSGRMYEVNIRAEPEQFLNYDVPLFKQGKLGKRAQELLPQFATNEPRVMYGKPEATAALREAGIPGIRYLDQGSRLNPDLAKQALEIVKGGGQRPFENAAEYAARLKYAEDEYRRATNPTSNYVLFRDDIIDILRKYGLAGLAATGAAGAAVAPTSKQQPGLLEM